MHCSICGCENRTGARFCNECGIPLLAHARYSKPTRLIEPGKKGAKVGSPSSETQTCEGERRHLTVMFCDVVGSTLLSGRLDPEELREVIRAYQNVSVETISRFGGYVAHYLGDGVLAYFGYPQAHEDDPQRAVRAGLEMVAKLSQLNEHLQETIHVIRELPLQIRISIHSGLVVAGEMGGGTTAIVGETPNIAARIQAIAPADSVVISAATHNLTGGYFTYRSLGPQTFKGISTPLDVYQVLGDSGAQSRFEVVARTGLTPLVGRDEELGLLLGCWDRVKEGGKRVVLLSGEPGIGKSRLVHEAEAEVGREGCPHIRFRCSPYYQNTALYPIIEHLQRLLRFRREDSSGEKLEKLQRKLEEYPLPRQEAVPLFAALLSLPFPDDYPRPRLSPQKQKEKTQEALAAWLISEADRNPVLTTWEDLQWADPSTLELLGFLVDEASTARILVLLTFRPEFRPTGGSPSDPTRIILTRLGHEQVETMVIRITSGKSVPKEVMQEIVGKTDGVPLFVEELTKMVLDSGLLTEKEDRYELRGPLAPLTIPTTLHDSLMARLDQLPETRRVAQLAATLGREFRGELLQAVLPTDERTLERDLSRLIDAGILYARGSFPHATYIFKHALIQEAAYQSLLKSTRHQYHHRVAQMLEQNFPEITETQPELVAQHFTQAGLNQQAIHYWQRAGQQAISRSATQEAIVHLTKGLDLLRNLPSSYERSQQELMLQASLGMALIFAKGYSAPDVQTAYARARELCAQLGETPQLYPVLWGLWAYYLVRGDYRASHEIGRHLLTVAEEQHDTDLLLEAHTSQGFNFFMGGCDLRTARMHFERALSLYEFENHSSHALAYGQDPGVVSLGVLSWTLWLQGYPEQALVKHEASLKLARQRSHDHSLAWALGYAAAFRQFRREIQVARGLAEEGMTFSTDRGFNLWSLAATFTLGWALNQIGQPESAVQVLGSATDKWRASGAHITRPHQLGLLADALRRVNRVEAALDLVDEALAEVRTTTEEYYEAELHRLRGELLFGRIVPDEVEAEAAYLRSLEVARRQGAKSWELRTATSLLRLKRKQGRYDQARQMLADIYGWFTEGFDTPDLQDAGALLAQFR